MAQRKKEWRKAESWVRRSTRGCTDFDMINDDYVPNINEGTLQLPTSPNRDCEGKEESDTAKNENRCERILGSSAGKRKCKEAVSSSEDVCFSERFPESREKDVKKKASKNPNSGGKPGKKKINKPLKLSSNEKGPLSTSDVGESENSCNRSILEDKPIENSSVFCLSSSSNDCLPNIASPKPTQTDFSQAGSSKKTSKKKGRPSKLPRNDNKTTRLDKDEKCLDDIATSSSETVNVGEKSLVKKNEKASEISQKVAKKKERPRTMQADVVNVVSTESNEDNLLVEHEKAAKEEAKKVVKKKQRAKKMQACSDGSLDKEPVDNCKSRDHEAILSTGFEALQHKKNEVTNKEKVGNILKKRGKPRKVLTDGDNTMLAESADGGKDQGNVDALATGFKIPQLMQNEVTFSNKVSKILKKRGRPRKASICSDNDISTDQNEEINEATLSTGLENCQTRGSEIAIKHRVGKIVKKKGKPRKIPNDGVTMLNEAFSVDYKLSGHVDISSTESETIQDDCKVLKRKRGRKRKLQGNSDEVLSTESDGNTMLSDLISPVLETDGQFKKPLKKRGRPKKVQTSKDVSLIEQSGFPSSDSRKLVSTATNSLFENEHGVAIPQKTKKLSDLQLSKRRKSYSKCTESLSSMEEDESCLESSLCRESSEESFEHESYVKKSSKATRRKPKEQMKKKRGRPPKKPVGEYKFKMLSTSQGKLHIDEEKLSQWVDEFTNGVFKCVISDCTEEFNTWFGLFKHSNDHNSEQQIFPLTELKVPCHVCKEIFSCGPIFAKHMRVVHNDVSF